MVDGLGAKYAKSAGIRTRDCPGSRCARRRSPGRASCPASRRARPQPEPPRVAGLPSDAELERRARASATSASTRATVRRREPRTKNTALSRARQSPAHRHARGDHRRPAAVQERRSVPRPAARRVGAHPARHALPARRADPPGGISRRRRRRRSHDAGCLDASIPDSPSAARAARTPRGFELEELNFLGTGTQLGVGFKSRRRSRFEDSSTTATGSWARRGGTWRRATPTTATAGWRSSRSNIRSTRSTRAGPRGVSLLDDQRTDSRYDLGEVIDQYQTHEKLRDYLLGLVRRPARTAGRAAIRSA